MSCHSPTFTHWDTFQYLCLTAFCGPKFNNNFIKSFFFGPNKRRRNFTSCWSLKLFHFCKLYMKTWKNMKNFIIIFPRYKYLRCCRPFSPSSSPCVFHSLPWESAWSFWVEILQSPRCRRQTGLLPRVTVRRAVRVEPSRSFLQIITEKNTQLVWSHRAYCKWFIEAVSSYTTR